jgi:hypothetical protein
LGVVVMTIPDFHGFELMPRIDAAAGRIVIL